VCPFGRPMSSQFRHCETRRCRPGMDLGRLPRIWFGRLLTPMDEWEDLMELRVILLSLMVDKDKAWIQFHRGFWSCFLFRNGVLLW